MSDHKTLLLVDGSSYLYRAFHAMPDLRAVPDDRDSPATGAIRGMINMLQLLRREVRAGYAACVFDAPGKTFRDDWYPAYKAHRTPMPDDLRSQIEPIHEVVRLLGWPVLCVPGIEADDVIGTLARTAADHGMEVIVSSGDKDLSQLVDQHITIIDTMSGKKRDVAGVTAEFGVPPALMVDYQTLVGDAVDNVPGVDEGRARRRPPSGCSSTARSMRWSSARTRSRARPARTCASRSTGCRRAGGC